jgi:hypothetical protein
MKIHTTLMRGLVLVPLLLFDSAKTLENPASLAPTGIISVQNHPDLTNTNDGSLHQVQGEDEYGFQVKFARLSC